MKYLLPILMGILALQSCADKDANQLLIEYINSGRPEEAIALVKLEECSNSPELCGKLGTGLLKFDEHIELGKKYVEEAVLNGHKLSNVVLANFLIAGNIWDLDAGRGIELLEEAGKSQIPEALYYLGIEYYQGINVDKDLNKALKLFEQSAELGHKFAPFNAGVLIYELNKDCDAAKKYFKQSAPYMVEAKHALKESNETGPCAW